MRPDASRAVAFGKRFRAPSRLTAGAGRQNPDLEERGGLRFQIIFRVTDAGSRAHHLDVACLGAAFVAHAVLMRDRTLPDIGDDFHVRVRMRREARVRGNLVVVPDVQVAPAHSVGVAVLGEGKMMLGFQPAVIRTAKPVEGSTFDHG